MIVARARISILKSLRRWKAHVVIRGGAGGGSVAGIHTLLAVGVFAINRIVADIGIEVELVLIADGIGLQEAAEGGGVEPRFVIIHAKLGDPRLAGVLEPADVGGAGDAPFIIAVDSHRRAVSVGDGDDAALMIGIKVASAGNACAFIPHQRHISPGPMDIAPQHRAAAVIFRDERIAVVEETGDTRRAAASTGACAGGRR